MAPKLPINLVTYEKFILTLKERIKVRCNIGNVGIILYDAHPFGEIRDNFRVTESGLKG